MYGTYNNYLDNKRRKRERQVDVYESRARATRRRPTISKSREAGVERALEYSMVSAFPGVDDYWCIEFAY